MNHIQLHTELSGVFADLKKGTIKHQVAKELTNTAGKILKNAFIEMRALQMGFDVDVPLLGIKQVDAVKLRKEIETPKHKKLK